MGSKVTGYDLRKSIRPQKFKTDEDLVKICPFHMFLVYLFYLIQSAVFHWPALLETISEITRPDLLVKQSKMND